MNARSVIYADDTSLFSANKDIINLQNTIQVAQDEAINSFSSNKLICNKDKTQNILLSLTQKQDLQSVKLLGFFLDSKLNWNIHINNICQRLSRVCFLFWKLRDLISVEYLRTSYYGLFQSHLSYGLILWGHATSVNNILLIQKRALRTMCGAHPLAHCRPLFIQMKILTVYNLYIFQILTFTKTNLNLFSTRQDTHTHFTRNRTQLDIPQHRLAKIGTSHQVNCLRFFNKLHESARTIPYSLFKNKLMAWLLLNPFYSLKEFLEYKIDIIF